MVSRRGRSPHETPDLRNRVAEIIEVTASKAQVQKGNPHYLCRYRVVEPYLSVTLVISVTAQDELQAFARARAILKAWGAKV